MSKTMLDSEQACDDAYARQEDELPTDWVAAIVLRSTVITFLRAVQACGDRLCCNGDS